MRVLVIGGTLFIGRALVHALVKRRHTVTVLHRKPTCRFDAVENLVADRNNPRQISAALSGRKFDAVFDNVYDWQRGTTAQQVEAAVEACGDVSRYVFMSSVAAYGEGLRHKESDPLAPDNHPESYVRNKAQTERMLFAHHARTGFPVVTLRPPYIYGPENPFYREAFFWDRILAGRRIIVPGDGKRLMQFIHVKDLVRLCLTVMIHPAAPGQAFNAADPKPVTQSRLVRMLADAAGMPARTIKVPREMIQQAGGNPMGDPMYFAQYYDMPPITMDAGKARRLLGFETTPFSKGLRQTFRWYRKEARARPDFSFEDHLIAL